MKVKSDKCNHSYKEEVSEKLSEFVTGVLMEEKKIELIEQIMDNYNKEDWDAWKESYKQEKELGEDEEEEEEITKGDFYRYEEVRESGVTNMWAVKAVEELTGLTKDKILEIMENYSEYKEQFNKETDEEEEEEEEEIKAEKIKI